MWVAWVNVTYVTTFRAFRLQMLRTEKLMLWNLPCARSRSNASKLDAVLVDQCFTPCLVATRDVLSSLHLFVHSGPRNVTRVQVFAQVLGHVHGRQPTVTLRVPSPGERRMLGHVLRGQPTMILRVSAQ